MSVAIEFDEFRRCAQQRGGFFSFGGPLFGRTVGSGFTTRTDHKVSLPPQAGFPRNDTTAREFDVVRMRAESEERS